MYMYDRYASAIAFHPDGNCIGVGTTDNVVKIWDVRVNRLLQHYQGTAHIVCYVTVPVVAAHDGPVNSIAFHSSGNYLLSGSNDGTLKVGVWVGVSMWVRDLVHVVHVNVWVEFGKKDKLFDLG